MSASDTILANAACPKCGDIYYLEIETTFFEPDYDDQRTMRPGETHPLARMAHKRAGWSRIRDTQPGHRFTLLGNFDEMVQCDCGCPCISLLHFLRKPGTITFERAELLDARDEIASRVDYGPVPDLDGRPAPERITDLQLALASRHPYLEKPQLGVWTALVGPTRCEACGDTRERMHKTLLAHPRSNVGQLFGIEWQGRAVMIGDRVRSDADAITVRGDIGSRGCQCGAGPARYVARFERKGGELELVDLALSAVEEVIEDDVVLVAREHDRRLRER